ncbi:MAG: mechanosensitive ion channel family protein [Alphaproteobacteria bacterium]|nr:MAG: mechanosensitive ion channel family protein [Alphaproteobacteria bacterium]
MRALVIPLRRTKWIIYALALWLSAIAIKQITWASRSYYVNIAATLVAAWVVISIVSRLIRNRFLANLFAVAAWVVVALNVVGLLDETVSLLDSAAITIGAFRLSLLLIVKGIILIAVLLWLATITSNFIEQRIRRHEDLAPALQVLLGKVLKFVLLTFALLTGLSMLGIDLTALTVFSGTLGLGLGFGLQKVVSNLISGIIILVDRSIKPGDVISLGNTFGWINSLRGRYVSVITRDGVEYLIPNESFITQEVVNWSYSSRDVRQEVRFGVSYDADPHEVRRIATEAASRLDRVLNARPPVCHLTGFGDSSLDFVLRFWIADPENGLANIKGAVLLALWDAFSEHGITIPYPHRQLLISEPIRIEAEGGDRGSAPAGGARERDEGGEQA